MVEGKSYTSYFSGRKLVFVRVTDTSFLHRQHIYYLVSMRLKYHYEFMGWDGLLLLNILHNNQLKELGDISNNAIANLPVHVFQGLHFLKEVN